MIPVRLDHIALDVKDRQRSIAFYRELLGAEVVAEDVPHRISFLRLPGSSNYSDLALHEHLDRDAAYPTSEMRMAHTGFGVERPEDLVRAFDFFGERTRVLLAADFGVAWSVMGCDPDGNVVEFELFHVAATSDQPGFAPLDIESLRRMSACA